MLQDIISVRFRTYLDAGAGKMLVHRYIVTNVLKTEKTLERCKWMSRDT